MITGSGVLRGRRVAVVAGEFGFLGGSIGVATAERLASAVERATEDRLPLIVAPASGGTRMQEGTVAFLQMIKIAAAVAAHKAAALPYLVCLRHPTTGGVLASWGSLGHLTLAEPGALIGFVGPRVYEALHGVPFPEGVQTAENLHAHGPELSRTAEEGGPAREIAHCLTEPATLPSPTVSLRLGQGTGGAALAVLPADRVLAAQHGWLAPLPLEGASAIVHRTTSRAADLAGAQRIKAKDLVEARLVDVVERRRRYRALP